MTMKSIQRLTLKLKLLSFLSLSSIIVVQTADASNAPVVTVDAVAGFSVTRNLISARANHSATLLANGKVLVVGGYNSVNFSLKSVELYDPGTGQWTATGDLNYARFNHTATLLTNGKVLVVGGMPVGALNSAELYDPATGTWTVTDSLSSGREYHTATLLTNGKVLVAGGRRSGYLASSEIYDPATGRWSSTGNLVRGRQDHTATLLTSGKVFITGGFNNSAFRDSAELYDPVAGTWTAATAPAYERNFHTATLLPSGKVLIAGGNTPGGIYNTAEIYDPSSNTWSTTSNLITGRQKHTATLLASGKVLIAGGDNGVSTNYSSAELYDAASGTWENTGSLATARWQHTITLLSNGKALVVGGLHNYGTALYLKRAELYDSFIPVASGKEGLLTTQTGTFADANGNSSVTLSASSGVITQNNAAGTWTWTDTGEDGPSASTITVTATDSSSASASVSFIFSVVNNWPSVSINAPAAAIRGTPVNITFSATDTGSLDQMAGFAWSLEYGGGAGETVVAGTPSPLARTHTFNTAFNYPIRATVWDRDGETSLVVSKTINIVDGNAPTISDVTDQSTNEDTEIRGIPVTIGDVETPAGSLTVSASSSNKVLVPDNRIYLSGSGASRNARVVPADNEFGTTTITLTVTDGSGLTRTDTFVLSVNPVNDLPSFIKGENKLHLFGANPVQSFEGWATGISDGDNGVTQSLTFNTSILSGGDLFSDVPKVSRTGALSYTLNGAIGTATVSITLTDDATAGGPALTTATQTFTIATAANNSPTVALGYPILPVGSLATVRDGHTATLLPNNKVLVAGGGNAAAGFLRSAELYDPATGAWTATGSLVSGRSGHTATLLPNGKVLVAGGSRNGFTLGSAELYDPVLGTWAATGSLAIARGFHTATLLPSGKVLVAGGAATSFLSSTELYDPVTGTWTATGSLATGRVDHSETLLSEGKVLIAGGYGDGFIALRSAEIYDPSSGSWTATGSLSTDRGTHTATLLSNGKVLVAGGFDPNGGVRSSVEAYNQATETWEAAGSLAFGRVAHSASILSSGKVLIVGGYGIGGDLTSAELYDPASGTMTMAGNLAIARDSHTAAVLSNGKVLIVGGLDNNDISLGSAELYTPLDSLAAFSEGSQASQIGVFSDADGNASSIVSASYGQISQNNVAGTWSWSATSVDGPATPAVTITVKDNGNATASTAFTFNVSNVAPTAAIDAPVATTVGADVSLTFNATDPSSVDQAAGFAWSVDFGDGTTETVTAGSLSPLSRSHRFANAGNCTVKVTVTDKDGAVSPVASKSVAIFNTATEAAVINWAASYGQTGDSAALNAIPFGDGVPNLIKYAFNIPLTGPNVGVMTPNTGTSGLPAISVPSTGGSPESIRVEFIRRRNSGLIYTPQYSSDGLEHFVPMGGTPIVTMIDANLERVVVEQPLGQPLPKATFCRVSVTSP